MIDRSLVKKHHFPVKYFVMIYGVLLLTSGIHFGLIQLFTFWNPGDVIKVLIPLAYWLFISYVIILMVKRLIKKYYETPLQGLATAMESVAGGDFSIYVSPIHTPNQLDYLDIMVMDFNRMVEELGSIETLKTDFLSNVSHEIKTPLAVISNYSQLLLIQGDLNEEQYEHIKNIQIACKKLSSLIGNILKLNKLEKQALIKEYEVYNVGEQLCDCVLQFDSLLEQKNLQLRADLDKRTYIKGDASLLEMVWNNLMSNAIKFTQIGGSIDIGLREEEENVVVSIRDNGCGMDEATMAHVFDKFFQGDTSRAEEGNGLGLALVQRIVQLSNGDVEVESQLGIGTIFRVKLPKGRKS